jgi:hypothetical protein
VVATSVARGEQREREHRAGESGLWRKKKMMKINGGPRWRSVRIENEKKKKKKKKRRRRRRRI